MKNSFLLFLALQAADFATTVIALRLGGAEMNPIVGRFMTTDPMGGLMLAKVIALAIGAICLFGKKQRAMHLSNAAFVAIIAWNMTIVLRLWNPLA
jgi:hypothetical protein